jgi:hypothetical protein
MGVDSSDSEWNGVMYVLFNITTGGGIYFDSYYFELDPGRSTSLSLYLLPAPTAAVTISITTTATGNSTITCPSAYTIAAGTLIAYIPCTAPSTSINEVGALTIGYVASGDPGYLPARAFVFGVAGSSGIYYHVLSVARNITTASSSTGSSGGSTTGDGFLPLTTPIAFGAVRCRVSVSVTIGSNRAASVRADLLLRFITTYSDYHSFWMLIVTTIIESITCRVGQCHIATLQSFYHH